MRILFIHKNFPAQFGAWGQWLAAQGHNVVFATERTDARSTAFQVVTYKPHRAPTDGIHHYLAGTEAGILASQGLVRTALAMTAKGYRPDVVIAHSGWGGGTFVKDIWPACRYIPYFEWYYHWPPQDATAHDDYGDNTLDRAMRCRGRNLPFLMDFDAADAVLCPTRFQASQFPDWMGAKLHVSHDGIDTDLHAPGPRNTDLLDDLAIPHDAEIMTWITRGMEPARGFPEMMGALATLQKSRPNLHAIIVGEDRVAYGARGDAISWKQKMLDAHDLDTSRLHFTGLVPRPRMIEILRLGHLHLYLTAPFVLSWSFLEAMACGCLLVASDCAPVREFLDDGKTGLLTDMNDPHDLSAMIARALDEQDALSPLRHAAREAIVSRLDAKTIAYPERQRFLDRVLAS